MASTNFCPVCKQAGNESCPIYYAWSNDIKMKYLFSAPNASKKFGPGHEIYDFWTTAIRHYCKYNGRFSLTVSDIKRVYRRNNVSALGIERIVLEMLEKEEMYKLKDLSQDSVSWMNSLAKKLI